MNVALGGDDPHLDRWAQTIVDCGAQVLPVEIPSSVPGSSGEDRRQPPRIPTARPDDPSQPGSRLLPDAAVLAGSAAAVLHAARAVGATTPLLVVPSAPHAAEIAYALLPQVEDGRRAVPAWSHRASAAVREYIARFTRGEFGDLQLLRLERTQLADDDRTPDRISRTAADEAFLHDVDLLRLLGGEYDRITAIEIGADSQRVRQLTVTLQGDAASDAVWTIVPGTACGWKLILTTARANALLQSNADGRIQLIVDGHDIPLTEKSVDCNLLQQFLHTVGDPLSSPLLEPLRPEWRDYVRAADLLAGLHRSLKRRRTINLHYEATSERSQFKTQMTAIGCGVLIWTLLGTCTGLIAGRILDPRDAAERRAAAAGTILEHDDFQDDGVTLAAPARERLVQQTALDGHEAIVLIEAADGSGTTAIDSDRLQSVTADLRSQTDGRLLPQVEVRPLSGRWFRRVMLVIWIATFLPLLVFLALQALITVARNPGERP